MIDMEAMIKWGREIQATIKADIKNMLQKKCAHDFGNGLRYYKHVPCCLKCGIKLTDVK